MSTTDASASTEREPATRVLINPIGNDADSWQFGPVSGQPVEYPGHGKQPRQPGWTHQSFAADILARFPGPLDLVGMSMGATVVAHILAAHPERVRSAVIASSGFGGRSASASEGQAAKRREALIGRGERAVKGGMVAVLDETLERWFSPFARRNNLPGVVYAREALLRLDPQAWNDIWLCNAISDPVPVERFAEIHTPVTIISGFSDASLGVEGLRGLARLHELFRNSRLELMPGPHMILLEQPGAFVAALDRHFVWAAEGQRVEAALGSARLD